MVGEHIRVRKGGRWHHAIDCGDETVLHLADEPGESPVRVRRSYRPEFVAGAETVEVVTHRERTFPPNEVIARAFSRIADPVLASMFRDSEAFAKWCATGRIPSGPEATPTEIEPPLPASAKPVSQKAPPPKGKAASGRARPTRPRPAAARSSTGKKKARRVKPRTSKPKKAPSRKSTKKAKAGGARRAPRRKR